MIRTTTTTPLFYLTAVFLFFASCGENAQQAEQPVTVPDTLNNQQDTTTYLAGTPFSGVNRTTKAIYEKEGIRVESYDFEGFEPFLHQSDEYTYVVNFWATWCGPCVKELPYFEQLRENYADQNVHVLLVSIDFSKAVETALIPFIQKEDLKSEVVLLDDPDANSWISKVNEDWSGAIPATVIYNKTDRLFFEGSVSYEELEARLLEIMN